MTHNAFYEQAQRTVGLNVRLRRLELGFSQEDFAQSAGIERARYGRIERGEANLTLRSIFALAENLRTDPRNLLNDIAFDSLREEGESHLGK